MRRILTSLPYERRIGLQGTADRLAITDSVRRTLLLPVADAHLDPDVESASGRLVKCDEAGSLLADVKSIGYLAFSSRDDTLYVDNEVMIFTMLPGYQRLELHRTVKSLITAVYLTDSSGTVLQELFIDQIIHAQGVIGQYWLQAIGTVGNMIDVRAYHFR